MINLRKIFKKSHIIVTLILIFFICYTIAFINARHKEAKPRVKYHKADELVEYGGYEYTFEKSTMYTTKEIMDKYGVDKNSLTAYTILSIDSKYDAKFMITRIHCKRVSEEVNPPEFYEFENRYVICCPEMQLTKLNLPKDYKKVKELKVGEETTWDEIAYINNCNIDKDLWKKLDKQTFYIQLSDYEGHEYMDRIRVLN